MAIQLQEVHMYTMEEQTGLRTRFLSWKKFLCVWLFEKQGEILWGGISWAKVYRAPFEVKDCINLGTGCGLI